MLVVAIASFAAGAVTVTVTLPWAEPDTLLAVTVTGWFVLATGAVNNPLVVMAPPVADHTTAESLVFVTIASNCRFPPETTLGVSGMILTLTELWPEDWPDRKSTR